MGMFKRWVRYFPSGNDRNLVEALVRPGVARVKELKGTVTYPVPGFVPTDTVTAASLNYTLLRRVIELPTGRQKKRR